MPAAARRAEGEELARRFFEAIRSVVNPDKLGRLGPVSDVARIPGRE